MSTPSALDWLVARPIAHRGLHDAAVGRFENTVSAARSAIAHRYAIECDVQRSSDGEAVVFHDFSLERLTDQNGPVCARSADALSRIAVKGSGDTIVSLPAFLDAIGGTTPLICEIKSAFDDDFRLTDRVLAIARSYRGPLALKSFDPAVLRRIRATMAQLVESIPIGIVAEAQYADREWAGLPFAVRKELAALTHLGETHPDFLSYWVEDLPHAAATLFRTALERPVVTWTVRTADQNAAAGRWADQIVFEGFTP